MELRNNKQVTDIIDHIKDVWQLSLNEEYLLDSVLILFSAQKTEKLKQVEYLLDDEINSLLGKLNDREVIEYCSEELGMVSSDDEDNLIGVLDDLNYNWIDKVDEEEMISALEDCGYTIDSDNYIPQNIVEESQFSEWTELFNSLSVQEIENILKGWYNGDKTND